MRLSLAVIVAALVLTLPAVSAAPVQAGTTSALLNRPELKHYKLDVRKKGKHYHFVHTYKSHAHAHKAAHKYHKRGYKTKIRVHRPPPRKLQAKSHRARRPRA